MIRTARAPGCLAATSLSLVLAALALASCTSPDAGGSTAPPPTSSAPRVAEAPEPTDSRTDTKDSMRYTDLLQLANDFRDSLDDEQRADLEHPYTFENASRWHTYPQWYLGGRGRLGVDLGTLGEPQWDRLDALLAAATGSGEHNGYQQIQQHLIADDYLRSIGAGDGYGRGDFRIAFLGTPSETGRWQLQFGGHHLAVNNTYENGALVSATPSFRGTEPPEFEYQGVRYRPEGREWDTFVALLASFTDEQLAQAHLNETYSDLLLAPGIDWAFPETPAGIKVSALDEEQRRLVREAVANYVSDADDASAEKYSATYDAELDDTYVSYSGGPSLTDSGDYIRIDGPSLWIELVMDTPYTSDGPHPHAVWRDKQDDYGGTRP